MMVDPEQIADERREQRQRAAAGVATDAGERLSHDGRTVAETDALLARLRGGCDGFRGRRWLATVRGDRRPRSACELRQALQDLAEVDGVAVDVVRAAVDAALTDEGSSLEAWTERLRRTLPRPGRAVGSLRAPTRGDGGGA